MFRYRIDHPYRPVHWRWERARLIKELGVRLPGKTRDDKWTVTAANFRGLKDACQDEVAIFELYERYPEIAMAYELWDETSYNETGRAHPLRYEIEARILARESAESIAAKAQLSPETVRWYEKVFFNVVDRIDNKMYIFHQVIGDKIQRSLNDSDYATLWKLYAYVRGSAMLDFLITTFTDWTKTPGDKIEQSLADDYRQTMKRKTTLAARMMGVNSYTQDRLIELHTKIVEVEKAAGEGGAEGIQNNIAVMLSQLPLLVGQQVSAAGDKVLLNYNKKKTGLRASELITLSTGSTPEVTEFEDFEFPEPNDATEAN